MFADDQLRVLWHQNDLVSIFNKYTYNKQYKFNGNTGDNAGSFSEVPGSEFVTGNALPLVYAVYPYNEATSISNDGAISLTFPATQSYSKKISFSQMTMSRTGSSNGQDGMTSPLI